MLVVGVLLLAGLIFAGGTLAVFMSPKDPAPTNPNVAVLPDSTRLQIFEQVTPTPVPTATPWFPSFTPGLPTDLLTPLPTFGTTLAPPTDPGLVTPRPTRPPTPRPTKTPEPTPTALPKPNAKFAASQAGFTLTVNVNNNAIGVVDSWFWDFGDGFTTTERDPGSHTYASFGPYHITLTATNTSGSDTASRDGTLQEEPVDTPTPETPAPTGTLGLVEPAQT